MKEDDKTKRQLLQELTELQGQFTAFMRFLPAGVFVKDEDGRFLYVNRYLKERFDAENWLGRTIAEVLPRQMSELMLVDDRIALKQGHLVRTNVVPDRHGVERIYETHKFPIEREGESTLLGGIAIEITDRRRVEEDRERLAKAVEQTGESIVITDAEGVIQYINPAFELVTGYTREEVIGANSRILKSGKQSAAFYQDMWQTISSGDIWSGRFINKRKDGSTYEEDATISPIRNASGAITNYLAVKRDVSQEIRLQEQLFQAQKMEAVGRLAGGVAHEFKNLLMVILNRAQFAIDRLPPDSAAARDLGEVLASTDRASALARQLLALSHRQPMEPKVVSMNAIIEDVRKLVHPLMGENIKIHFEPIADIGNVRVDIAQIEQIIMNLAVNARDAMAAGGTLSVETRNVHLGKESCYRLVDVTDFSPGDYVMLAISDNGGGMAPEVKSRIFEPFFTTKSRPEGTGLGLAIVYGIVKQHDGYLAVESEPGNGTTFSIYLPRIEESADEAAAMEKKNRALPLGHEKVLVVEDDPAVRSMTTKILKALGYSAIGAPTSQEAIKLAEEQGGFDLLLADVILPDTDGKMLAEELMERGLASRVLFMSGYIDGRISESSHGSINHRLITKPFTRDVLARRVREALDG
jgi:PAS domain S-box-containing protein